MTLQTIPLDHAMDTQNPRIPCPKGPWPSSCPVYASSSSILLSHCQGRTVGGGMSEEMKHGTWARQSMSLHKNPG